MINWCYWRQFAIGVKTHSSFKNGDANSQLALFRQIFYNISNIDLPEYYTKYSGEDRKRLRSSIKPPDYFGGNAQTINLQKLREAKFNDLSLKLGVGSTW